MLDDTLGVILPEPTSLHLTPRALLAELDTLNAASRHYRNGGHHHQADACAAKVMRRLLGAPLLERVRWGFRDE